MNSEERIGHYLAQTGKKTLTPRQRRRLIHKDPKAVVPEAPAKGKSGGKSAK